MCNDDYRRTYIEHLRNEHRRLHRLLGDIKSAITGSIESEKSPFSFPIAQLLRQLSEQLKHHFAEEEAGGCLEEAICHCPSLSGEEKRITSEHAAILAETNDLFEQAAALPAKRRNLVGIKEAFERLLLRIRIHEAAENRLLSRGFGIAVTDAMRDE
jgi:hemerythrin